MLLIADGGSTKTNWCLIDGSGNVSSFNSEGYNPYFVDSEYITKSLRDVLPLGMACEKIESIYFYGAGIQNEDKAAVLKKAFSPIFPNSSTYVGHDLLASARALLGSEAGFAAILGTGTNSCLYNGSQITHHIDSGAHILGDEGSGFYIGKRVLIDYLRGWMPEPLRQRFKEKYNLNSDDVHEAVYSKPLANRYCASFSQFVYENFQEFEYCRKLVHSSFDDFFRNIVSLYPDFRNYKFNCIGSVGFSFQETLSQVATQWGMDVGLIVKSPLERLVVYHKNKLKSEV